MKFYSIKQLFIAICNALRVKENSSALIPHVDIPQRILDLSGGFKLNPYAEGANSKSFYGNVIFYDAQRPGTLYFMLAANDGSGYTTQMYSQATLDGVSLGSMGGSYWYRGTGGGQCHCVYGSLSGWPQDKRVYSCSNTYTDQQSGTYNGSYHYNRYYTHRFTSQPESTAPRTNKQVWMLYNNSNLYWTDDANALAAMDLAQWHKVTCAAAPSYGNNIYHVGNSWMSGSNYNHFNFIQTATDWKSVSGLPSGYLKNAVNFKNQSLCGTSQGYLFMGTEFSDYLNGFKASGNIYGLAASAELAIAVDYNKNIYTSTDGIHWTQQNFQPTSTPKELQYLNGKFYLLSGQYLYSSINGVEWDTIELSVTNSKHIFYCNNKYIITLSGGNSLLLSDDGIEWESMSLEDNIYLIDDMIESNGDIHFICQKLVDGNYPTYWCKTSDMFATITTYTSTNMNHLLTTMADIPIEEKEEE